MKLIRAIVNPGKLDAVKKAVWDAGVRGMTVSEVSGFGYEKNAVLARRAEYAVELTARMAVEVVAADAEVEGILAAVQKAAWTGRIGDGKIFVMPVEDAVRIRTGERGEPAV